MNAELKCLSCITRQVVDYSHTFISDKQIQREILKSVFQFLNSASLNVSPPELGKTVYQIIRNISKNDDPFKKIKQKDNSTVLNMYPHLKSLVYSNSHPVKTAAKFAIAGNIIDYGAYHNGVNINQISKNLNQININEKHWKSFLENIEKANHVLYLADNAGEIVFDKLFIEMLHRFYIINDNQITVVVRGAPVLNDSTIEDANFIKMDEVAQVIDNGDDAPGTLLEYCSPEMNTYFENSDLIISKGQGNYETLDTEDKLIYFLLKVKCPVIAKHLNVKEGDSILKCNRIN